MKYKGYMSVFFSLSILCICALLFAMVETARMAGARCYLQTAVNSAIDSVFSQYHRELWEQYRLLFVEYETESEAAADFKKFLNPYLDADSWYPMTDEGTEIEQMLAATDFGGDFLEQEILDYMKLGIWKMDFKAEDMEQLLQGGKEAAAVHEIADSYRGSTRDAWRLEQALEQIGGCMEEQQKLLEEADSCLDDYDGNGFCKKVQALIKQLRRIPSLINGYEKRADQLLKTLEESKELLNTEKDKLTDSMRQGLEQEIREYESYLVRDGERRMEIEALGGWSEAQILVAESALEAAGEVMDILADWDDEEEEPDEEALWGRVKRSLQNFEERSLSVIYGIKDKEKQNWLEQAESLFQLNILSLVLPEGAKVSHKVLDMSDLPSGNRSVSGTRAGALTDRLLVTEYCGRFFPDFRESVQGQERPVSYELEYLFAGDALEENNLEQMVSRILLLREGWNLIHIFSDAGKRAEAREMAATIVGATGLAPLVFVTAFFIMSVWALGEAILDLRLLLDGQKVPLMKTAGDWQLTLENLLLAGQDGALPQQKEQNRGLTYEAYVKFILFFMEREDLYFRIMDLIQINLRRQQESFRMKHATYRLDIRETVTGRHVFLSPGFFRPYRDGADNSYKYQAAAQKAY